MERHRHAKWQSKSDGTLPRPRRWRLLRRAVFGDWHPLLRDPLDLLRLSLAAAAAGFWPRGQPRVFVAPGGNVPAGGGGTAAAAAPALRPALHHRDVAAGEGQRPAPLREHRLMGEPRISSSPSRASPCSTSCSSVSGAAPPRSPTKGTRRATTSGWPRYVFPDGELHSVTTVIAAMERAGLEVRALESLREHYALPLGREPRAPTRRGDRRGRCGARRS